MATVTTTIDGEETTFQLEQHGSSVLDAAIAAGVDAPYSCKGGVCTTCMAKVTEVAWLRLLKAVLPWMPTLHLRIRKWLMDTSSAASRTPPLRC